MKETKDWHSTWLAFTPEEMATIAKDFSAAIRTAVEKPEQRDRAIDTLNHRLRPLGVRVEVIPSMR